MSQIDSPFANASPDHLHAISTALHNRARRDSRESATDFEEWCRRRFKYLDWDQPHHRYIFNALERVTSGEIRKLMIFMPPRHGKSTMVTQCYTAWRMITNPSKPLILGAYNQTLADKFSRRIRKIVREEVRLSPERSAQNDWETVFGGGLRAAGVASGIAGLGGWGIVIDDPVRGREAADSEAFREKLWEWYTDDLYTRREPNSWMVLIMTRWHDDDLAGRILNSPDADEWTVLHVPAIAEENDPLNREPGEALWEERVPRDEILKYREFNERGFWALYQGQPQPAGGVIYLRDWWDGKNRFDPEAPPQTLTRIISVDTGESMSESSAYTAMVVADLVETPRGHALAVRHVWRRRVAFSSLLDALVDVATEWRGETVGGGQLLQELWVEETSLGRAAIDMLRKESPDWFPHIRAYRPRASKDSRGHMAARPCKIGRVLLPNPHPSVPWLPAFEQELYDQPAATYRDQADAFAQAVINPSIRPYLVSGFESAVRLEEAA